jgi:hypothetical protein
MFPNHGLHTEASQQITSALQAVSLYWTCRRDDRHFVACANWNGTAQ